MNIDIRKSIINNFKDISIEELRSSIEEAISDNEEIILPGIGVLFEILWKNSNDKEKEFILNNIFNNIKKA